MTNLSDLPNEILVRIFTYDVVNCGLRPRGAAFLQFFDATASLHGRQINLSYHPYRMINRKLYRAAEEAWRQKQEVRKGVVPRIDFEIARKGRQT